MDYARDIELVRVLAFGSKVRELLRVPATLASNAMAPGLLRGLFTVVAGTTSSSAAHQTLDLVWYHRYGVDASRAATPLARALWESSTKPIGSILTYGDMKEYRDVLGVPVGAFPNYPKGWVQCPATDAELLARARGRDWMFASGDEGTAVMTPDEYPEHAVAVPKTQELIDDIRSIPGCRAHVLWGPPRAGKSIAAKQIARAVGGSWSRVCGSVCKSPDVWRALDVLRPEALIIDDIDVNAGEESPLMLGLEQAREWARVIISTANVVPTGDGKPGTLRGAVIGRASDGALIEYRELPTEVRKALAPDVPDDLETSDLLAQHQVELQRRAKARGVTQADVDELRKLQALIGDR